MTTTTFEKTIAYDRNSRDFRATLNGELIGYYPTYSAAEVALDQVAYDLLMDAQCAIVGELDGGASVEEIAADTLPAGWMRMPEGDILDADGMRVQPQSSLCPDCQGSGWVPNGWGTGDQAGGWADTCACQDRRDPPVDDPTPPPWEQSKASLTLSDTAELAVELSTVDGLALAEARALAEIHLQRITHAAGPVCTNCGNYGHLAIDCPNAPLPLPRPRPRGPSPVIASALLLVAA